MPKNTVVINNIELGVEIAITPQEKNKGLMFRETLEKNTGMLFVFESEQTLNFWMKNTYIPLSIAYINKGCVIVDIQDMQPSTKDKNILKSYPSAKPSQYALEVNQGWFTNNKIKVGDKLIFKMNNLKFNCE